MKVFNLIDSGGLYGSERVLLTLCEEQKIFYLEKQLETATFKYSKESFARSYPKIYKSIWQAEL